MKRKLLSILLPILSVFAYLTLSSNSGGITGITASTGGCSCHNPSPSSNTVINLSGLPSTGYANGVTYTLTLTVTNPTVVGPQPRDGFDMIASDGSFTPITGTDLNGSNELHHTIPQNANNGEVSWTFDWSAPASGHAPITFEVACNATNGDGINGIEDQWNTYTTTLSSSSLGSSTLDIRLFLEGYYLSESLMSPALYNQGVSLNSNEVDSIQVDLRDPVSYESVMIVPAVVSSDGNASCDFGTLSGSYYLAISSRNSLLTWSSEPISIGSGNSFYDFTGESSSAYGDNMKEVEPGIWAFYSGDLNADENLDLLDIGAVETDINNFQFGNFPTDINGDGNVDLLDTPALEVNIGNFIFSNHP